MDPVCFEEVPGVNNNWNGRYDMCYDPNLDNRVAIVYKGNNGCTSTEQCNEGEVGCKKDSDCISGLKCFER